MQYLLLAVLSIIAYTEVLPTLSLIFEYIRTWLALGITITQQKTVIIQEQTQEAQERLQPQQVHAIGFQYQGEECEEEDEDE